MRNVTAMKRSDTDCIPQANTPPPAAPSLETILAELRRLAIGALDGGHPLVAAKIAATADQVEAAAWPPRPPRPRYGAGRAAQAAPPAEDTPPPITGAPPPG